MSEHKPQKPTELRISILIPCYNEELTIERCVLSCLNQTRKPDQIVVVNDCSKDGSAEILERYTDRITVVKTPRNTGNKSSAQEYGLGFITGEIVIMTDGDTVIDPNFVNEIIKDFNNPEIVASSGAVRSMKYNWLTRCRAFEYVVSNNIHKLSQSYLNTMLVIPGAAGAFRTDIFRKYLTFDHDTITEDLDFTYKLHRNNMKIAYNRNAIVWTQDPANLYSYINQMRRWFGGGWQNLIKHRDMVLEKPWSALELSLLYIEGLLFSILLLALPIIDLHLSLILLVPWIGIAFLFAIYAAIKEKRPDLLLTPVYYIVLMYINSYIFVEQFFKEVILGKKTLTWFKPERVRI